MTAPHLRAACIRAAQAEGAARAAEAEIEVVQRQTAALKRELEGLAASNQRHQQELLAASSWGGQPAGPALGDCAAGAASSNGGCGRSR